METCLGSAARGEEVKRRVIAAAIAAVSTLTCRGCPPAQQAPAIDTRGTRMAQLEKENERLRTESEAAQQASVKLDETLRGVEQGLSTLPGIDADIRDLRQNIETGINEKPDQRKASRMMERLQKMLQERRDLVLQAKTRLADANRQAATLAEQFRKRYTDEIARLETAITAQEAENSRLRDERDDLEKKLKVATDDAKQAHEEVATISSELHQEHQQREEAENLANRVLVAAAKIADLRRKGVVSGRWYQHKTTRCTCSDCFTEYDRRTLASVDIPAPLRRVHIYSVHPPDSYRLLPKGQTAAVLEIRDPDKFWSGARCAVVGF